MVSFLSFLLPRTFESEAGSVERSAGGSIMQRYLDFYKPTRVNPISECKLGEGKKTTKNK
jgi:hypothetical protein